MFFYSLLIGEKMESISDYFSQVISRAQTEITSKDDAYLIGIDTSKLVNYYFEKDSLPLIEKDEMRGISYDQKKPVERTLGDSGIIVSRQIHLKILYPIKVKNRIEEVIKRTASTFYAGYIIYYDNGNILSDVLISIEGQGQEKIIEEEIKRIETTIERKNVNVRSGNEQIRSQLTEFIENRKKRIEADNAFVDQFIQKVPVKLSRKQEGKVKPIDLNVKREILPIYPSAEKPTEPYLEAEKVEAILSLIENQGYAFEVTPSAYSKFDEENLRDVILGMLNSVFEGGATGETFVKRGKTDIHLNLEKGSILSAECKIWDGEQLYSDTISQLFKYLVWRQNYGIIITFSKRKEFTDVLQNAKKAIISHPTIIKKEIQEKNTSHFTSIHHFPEDPKKTVNIHHLLFNLYES
jgi:hypothetical protein